MPSLADSHMPTSFEKIKGQNDVIDAIKSDLANDRYPHYMFEGPPGCGKTATAMAYLHERYNKNWRDHAKISNASDKRGIDDVRRLRAYFESRGERTIVLDEADYLTSQAQAALRGPMADKDTETNVVITANYPHKIIDAIRSRCVIHKFARVDDKQVLDRVLTVAREEGMDINWSKDTKKALFELVKKKNGDVRGAINLIGKVADESNTITAEGIQKYMQPPHVEEAFKKAYNGNLRDAVNIIEDSVIRHNFSTQEITRELNDVIMNIVDRKWVKVALLKKLSELERGLMTPGATRQVQLAGFLAHVMQTKFLKTKFVRRDANE